MATSSVFVVHENTNIKNRKGPIVVASIAQLLGHNIILVTMTISINFIGCSKRQVREATKNKNDAFFFVKILVFFTEMQNYSLILIGQKEQ